RAKRPGSFRFGPHRVRGGRDAIHSFGGFLWFRPNVGAVSYACFMSSKAVRESRAKSAEVAAIPSEDAVLARVREVRKTQRDAELELFLLALETARRSPVTEECSIIDCRTSRDLPVSYCDRATNWFAAVAGF